MSRTPPAEVLRTLRAQAGFGCPVPGCGNPYLEWHHFDPPYRVEQHHRPEGMIALCVEHHKKADAGAYTTDQLRHFKSNQANTDLVRGSFDWLRRRFLLVVGGTFFFETQKAIVLDDIDVVAFTRDPDGYLRLNVELPSISAEPRALIKESNWFNIGTPSELVSPPSGRRLQVAYGSGDSLAVEFSALESADAATKKFGTRDFSEDVDLPWPLTCIEVNLTIGEVGISLTPSGTTISGGALMPGGLVSNGFIGFKLRLGLPWRHNTTSGQIPNYPRLAACPCRSSIRYKDCHGRVA